MDRRRFVKASVAATLAVGIDTTAQPTLKRKHPNILFVFGDQHRAQSLPGEPFSQVVAPNTDAFRRQNFSMDTCVSNYPLCTPYRGILLSGKWPSESGIMFNNRVLSMKNGALGHTFARLATRLPTWVSGIWAGTGKRLALFRVDRAGWGSRTTGRRGIRRTSTFTHGPMIPSRARRSSRRDGSPHA